jgi:class 3 adenylate cyclase
VNETEDKPPARSAESGGHPGGDDPDPPSPTPSAVVSISEAADPGGVARSGRWRLPISAVLAAGFGGLVAAAVGAVLWLSLEAAEQATNDLLRQTAEHQIESVVGNLEHHLLPARNQVAFLAAQIEGSQVAVDDDARLKDLLLGTLAATPQVTGMAFFRDDLHAVWAGREEGAYETWSGSWVDRPEVRLALREAPSLSGFTWGGPVFVETEGSTFLAPRQPVHVGGRLAGVVTAVVSTAELSDFLQSSGNALGGVSFVLYGRDQVFAHPALVDDASPIHGLLGTDHPLPTIPEIGDPVLAAIWSEPADTIDEILAGTSIKGGVIEVGDAYHVVLYSEIPEFGTTPWIVGVHFSTDAVNAPIRRLMLAGVVGLGILVVAVIAALLLGRAIARPVRRLAAAADAIRALDPGRIRTLPRSPLRELDSAALAFNSMIKGLGWFATYVPRSLVLLLMRRGDAELVSEERALTVLFTDMIGFSAISQRLTPPQLADFLNRHFGLLAACIEAEGGTVDKYIGDSVMAFWGAPEPQPDHAARACRAAKRIAEALHADNTRRTAKGLRPVRVRIGIHSGPAIAGNIGAPGRINYTLIGDTVNTAQRLEQLGKEVDDGVADAVVLVSGATAAQAPDAGLSPLGTHTLRGRADETEIYRLG